MSLFKAWWYRLLHDPCNPLLERRLDDIPLPAHLGKGFVPYVASDHPADCAKSCCWEIRLTEMEANFDWHAAEHEMRSKR